jgi:hypothetical protein
MINMLPIDGGGEADHPRDRYHHRRVIAAEIPGSLLAT